MCGPWRFLTTREIGYAPPPRVVRQGYAYEPGTLLRAVRVLIFKYSLKKLGSNRETLTLTTRNPSEIEPETRNPHTKVNPKRATRTQAMLEKTETGWKIAHMHRTTKSQPRFQPSVA